MKRGLLLPVLFCAGLTAALGLARTGAREGRTARSALAAVNRRNLLLQAGIRRLENELAADRDKIARLSADRPASTDSPVSPDAVAALPSRVVVVVTHPKVLASYLAFYQAGLALKFTPLYRDLGLSPARIAAFEKLMVEHRDAIVTLHALAESQGLAAADPAIMAIQLEESARLRADQIALLGAGGYAQFQELERGEALWSITSDVASQLALTPEPLSDAQARAVIQIIADADSRYDSDGKADSELKYIDWAKVLPAASAVLSPSQLPFLQLYALRSREIQLRDQFYQQQNPEK